MSKSNIGWTEHTVNPFKAYDPSREATGHFCQKVSPGCKNCYASSLQKRFRMHEYTVSNRENVELFLQEKDLDYVVKRKEPTLFFWCSMTDMFWEEYPDEWIDRCFGTMFEASHHFHLVLTKHPDRARSYLEDRHRIVRVSCKSYNDNIRRDPRKKDFVRSSDFIKLLGERWPLPNVMLGTSVESQDYVGRLDDLAACNVAYRFVSCEPLIDKVDLSKHLSVESYEGRWRSTLQPKSLDWVIVGGESGPNARPMNPNWLMLLKDQCSPASVPFFFKQWGRWLPLSDQYPSASWEYNSDGVQYLHSIKVDGVTYCGNNVQCDSDDPFIYAAVGKSASGNLLHSQRLEVFPSCISSHLRGVNP